ncbi:MAG TPA: L,D-transpeptidase [Jatrophihabitans sp.]|nr:L,D-transpeptidase [Jatrophihabitans sp.]
MFRRIALVALPVLLLATACTQAPQAAHGPSGTSAPTSSAGSSTAPSSAGQSSSSAATPTSSSAAPTRAVHVSLLEGDGAVYGVGMPIIALFNVAPTSGVAFAKATQVKVNGVPAAGAWYFEPTAHKGSALEGHFRLAKYWPAHSQISMNLPVKGLSAGPGLAFDDNLTLDFSTSFAIVSTVNAINLQMTVTVDGHVYGTYPVSLGALNTRTLRGTKVIMEKGVDIPMRGPGYYDAHVQWTQRLTYGGEYLHSAPWNVANLGVRSTSNGCTNLSPAAAKHLYSLMRVGDVVNYPNANGATMQLGQGYGDWNVAWSSWLTGGAIRTG